MERRFYCPEQLGEGESVTLPEDESYHMTKVLRSRVGDAVMLLNGLGQVATAEVSEIPGRRKPVTCKVVTVTDTMEPAVRFRLYVAPPRGKGMAGLVRAATELGVARITPIICQRATSRPEPEVPESWNSAAITALKQSINPWCPNIDAPVDLSEVLAGPVEPGYVGMVPRGDAPISTGERPESPQVSLFIGPEGGFTADEADAIIEKNIEPVVFGPYVLRIETAVVAGLTWLNRTYVL